MARNICIFSDGTGQGGGANPIDWTNVYRLFMATRDADATGQNASTTLVSGLIRTESGVVRGGGSRTSSLRQRAMASPTTLSIAMRR